MKTNLKVEFRTTRVFESYYQSLYVNDVKTNIYYPEKTSILDPNAKEKAIAEAKLIQDGLIFPHDGNYDMFDICGTYYANFQDAVKVVDEIKDEYKNRIKTVTGKDYSSLEVQEETLSEIRKNIAEWTQWIKRIEPNTYKLLYNIGVKFGNYGYSIFFY